jgi:hypothetical protein
MRDDEERKPKGKKHKRELFNDVQDEDVEFVECPECEHRQPDTGHFVSCENCNWNPMPTKGD